MRSSLSPRLLIGILSLVVLAQSCRAKDEVVRTGVEDPRLASFDRLMARFVEEHKLPGAALAVSKNGRLVYARGFGYADKENHTSVGPDSLFRIASISKPFTAVAVLGLIERGKLKLDDKVFPLLKIEPRLEPGAKMDDRLNQVTVRELLNHTGGFDRNKSFDPMFRPIRIARALDRTPPAEPRDIIRYVLGQPLDFDPGERYAYSNFGYCVLGRVIEQVSGERYGAYVARHVLAPLGIKDMRLGHTLPAKRAPREVKYYEGDKTVPAVVGVLGKQVPVPYGGWYLEAMDAHGGWLASAVDLTRFADAFNDPAHCKILKPASIAVMLAPPPGAAGHKPDGAVRQSYYGCGWQVVRVGNGGQRNAFHGGSLDGTSTLLVRRHDGLNWAVLFNTRNGGGKGTPGGMIDRLIHEAADEVKIWPDKDLYGKLLQHPSR